MEPQRYRNEKFVLVNNRLEGATRYRCGTAKVIKSALLRADPTSRYPRPDAAPTLPGRLVSGRSFAEPIAVVRGTERAGRDRRPAHAGWSDGRHLQLCFGMEHRRQARRLRRPAARLRGLTAEAPAEGVAMVPLTAQWPAPRPGGDPCGDSDAAGTGRRGGDRAAAPAGAWSRSAETWDRQQRASVEKPLWHCRADIFSG